MICTTDKMVAGAGAIGTGGMDAMGGGGSIKLGRAVLSCAKWCPLENCTILVIGEKINANLIRI